MRKLLIVLLILLGVCFASQAKASKEPLIITEIAGSHLSSTQLENLNYAKIDVLQLCQKHPRDCHDFTLTALSIMWQESLAGKLGPVGDAQNGFGRRSYGVMQLKLRTARRVLTLYPKLKREYFPNRIIYDEEVISRLLLDRRFNILIGILIIQRLHYVKHLSWNYAIRAYNQGYGGRYNHQSKVYLHKISKVEKLPSIQTFSGDR